MTRLSYRTERQLTPCNDRLNRDSVLNSTSAENLPIHILINNFFLNAILFLHYNNPSEGEYVQQDGSIVRSGQGRHETTDGSVYEGEWLEDKMAGQVR